MFFYPGAYVNFTDDFSQITHFQQLKIYCAGCFHNIVLAVLSALVLFSLPLILSPLYFNENNGALVTHVYEVKGIIIGDNCKREVRLKLVCKKGTLLLK